MDAIQFVLYTPTQGCEQRIGDTEDTRRIAERCWVAPLGWRWHTHASSKGRQTSRGLETAATGARSNERLQVPRAMKKEVHRWYSHRLGLELGVVVYGHWGAPIVGFPTSAGDEWELEGQGL